MKKGKFQARYQVHEYPGRKPWYVVRKYIEKYSRANEIVLEPFSGSGVVPCEALIVKRKVIALDIDPLAVFISKMTSTSPVNLTKLQQSFAKIKQSAKNTIYNLYLLNDNCNSCSSQLIMSSVSRMPDTQEVYIKAFCAKCNASHEQSTNLQIWENIADRSIPYWYPKDIELPNGIRGNIHYLHELYTTRNLKALSILWRFINLVKDEIYRDLLKLCFSANLSKASSINIPKITGKGWTASDYDAYNIADNFIEFNVWDGFANKFQQCLEAKAQTNQLVGDFNASASILNSSSENLASIADSSIDYVLTDPPYAETVKYNERNFVRNTWLRFEIRHAQQEYSTMIRQVLREINRVLKPGKHLSVLLKATSQEFRDKFTYIARSSGLELITVDSEHLGYVDIHRKPVDHILTFVNT